MSSIAKESSDFLAAHGRAYLYVLDGEGKVRGWPMIARYADGALIMTSYRKAPKVPHLAAAKRATVVITSHEGTTPFRYAVAEGRLSLCDITPDMADDVTRRMHGGMAVDDGTQAHFHARLLEGKRCLIEVAVETAPLFTMTEPA